MLIPATLTFASMMQLSVLVPSNTATSLEFGTCPQSQLAEWFQSPVAPPLFQVQLAADTSVADDARSAINKKARKANDFIKLATRNIEPLSLFTKHTYFIGQKTKKLKGIEQFKCSINASCRELI
jgi:hypothetical protein